MAEAARAVTWEALEHHHVEKDSDWFWVLGILAFAVAAVAFFFGNFLLAILIIIGSGSIALVANREPHVIPYSVSTRGLRVDDHLYPYSSLEAFFIDEDHELGPHLFARSQKLFGPLIIMPLPEEYVEEIEDILELRLPEEHIEEPLVNKILEIFGF